MKNRNVRRGSEHALRSQDPVHGFVDTRFADFPAFYSFYHRIDRAFEIAGLHDHIAAGFDGFHAGSAGRKVITDGIHHQGVTYYDSLKSQLTSFCVSYHKISSIFHNITSITY